MGFYIFILFVLVIVLFYKQSRLKEKLLDEIKELEKKVHEFLLAQPPPKPKETAAKAVPEDILVPAREKKEHGEVIAPVPPVPPVPPEPELITEPVPGPEPVPEPEPVPVPEPVHGLEEEEVPVSPAESEEESMDKVPAGVEEQLEDAGKEPEAEEVVRSPYRSPAAERPMSAWQERWQQFRQTVDWEQFTGTKLLAWIGVVALFIAAGFFVKYSIDNNLIPAKLRLVIGAVVGVFLLIGAGGFKTGKYNIMRQVLTASGIGVLYSVVFAAVLYYRYIPKSYGFGLLVLISAAAFVLAVFHKSKVVAVLGAIGAYATPILVSTGSGSLVMLFIYLAIVNTGLYLVVRALESGGLLLVACLGTLIVLSLASFFAPIEQQNLTIALVWLANLILFSLFIDLSGMTPDRFVSISLSGIFLYIAMVGTALVLFTRDEGWTPLLLMTASVIAAVVLTYRQKSWFPRLFPYLSITLGMTILWTLYRFDPESLSMSFLLFFLYGIAAGLGPLILFKKHGMENQTFRWLKIFPVTIVAIGMLVLYIHREVSFWFWPMIIALHLSVVGIALLLRSLVQVFISIGLLVIGVLYWVTWLPQYQIDAVFFLLLLFFGILLSVSVIWAIKKIPSLDSFLQVEKKAAYFPALRQWLSSLPVLGAFILLSAAFCVKYKSFPHVGLAAFAAFLVLVLFLCQRSSFQPPAVTTLIAAAAAQAMLVLNPANTLDFYFQLLVWCSAFFIISLIVPFVAFKDSAQWRYTWMAWALFEVSQGLFIIFCSHRLWPKDIAGWVPLGLVILKLPAVYALLKKLSGTKERNAIAAFHGGALLLYLSALPVLLLDQGWMALTLVFEAAALLWLNRRVEHPGLRWVSLFMAPLGLMLLLNALPQLKVPGSPPVLNSAVLSVTAALAALAGAVKFSPFPQRLLKKLDLPYYFTWLLAGTGFFLVNLIIADIFAAPGQSFQVKPDGDFQQSAFYALSWAFFGGLLWKIKNLHRSLRIAGLWVLAAGACWIIILPFSLPQAIAEMPPLFNSALATYLPFAALLLLLVVTEPKEAGNRIFKNTFTWFFLLALFIGIKIEASTIFHPGGSFRIFFSQTLRMAVASAAGWFVYGLALLLWPKNLDRIFRGFGVLLILAGTFKAVLLPLRFGEEFGSLEPLANAPTLLYLAILVCFILLTLKTQWKKGWPLQTTPPRPFWGVLLAIFAFCVLNIEIAATFGIPGQTFSLETRGSLMMELAYSISWLVFSVILLVIGIKWNSVKTRWAALILLVLTSLKIFLKDLGSLGQLYRVASFVGLAAVLILVSFLYQRYLAKGGRGQS